MRGRKIAHMLVDKVLQVRPLLILAGGDVAIVENIRSWWQNDVAKLQHDMTCGQSSSSESLNTTGVWVWQHDANDVIQAARDLKFCYFFRLWPVDVIQAARDVKFLIFLNSNLVDVIQAARDLRFRLWPDDVIQAARDHGERQVVLETSCHQTAALRFYYKTGWTEVNSFLCFKVASRVGQMSLCSKLFFSVLGFT